jgi:hypothetical protein
MQPFLNTIRGLRKHYEDLEIRNVLTCVISSSDMGVLNLLTGLGLRVGPAGKVDSNLSGAQGLIQQVYSELARNHSHYRNNPQDFKIALLEAFSYGFKTNSTSLRPATKSVMRNRIWKPDLQPKDL